MPEKKTEVLCVVCNPTEAQPGDYCDLHRDELHRLDHQYETLFRLRRTSRGKDHETYSLFMQGDCESCGRVLVTETDPGNLAITVLISSDLNLDTPIADYNSLMIERTFGDELHDRIEQGIIHSWYGNARACVDVYRTTAEQPIHWDVAPREQGAEEETSEAEQPQGGRNSVH
jgi:hypothetical protein